SQTRSTLCSCTARSSRSVSARRAAISFLRSVSRSLPGLFIGARLLSWWAAPLCRTRARDLCKTAPMPAPRAITARHELVDHCIELLGSIGPCTSRRMFGGHGFYVDGLFIALIAYERLFLKTDEQSRPRFLAAGCEPFVFEKQGEAIA